MVERKYFNPKQCAQLMGVSEALVRKLIRNKKLACFKFGSILRVDEQDLIRFMAQSYSGGETECIS